MTHFYPPSSNNLFDFQWGRVEAGYVLAEEPLFSAAATLKREPPPKVLVVKKRKGGGMTMYPPRAERSLHRRFSRLPDDPKAVLKFIAKYGFLGVSGDNSTGIDSESVEEILACRDKLREAQDLVDNSDKIVRAYKRTASEMRDMGEPVYGDPGEFTQIAGGLFNRFAGRSMEHFRLTIVPTTDKRGKQVTTLHVRPRTLLSSLWLSTAEEITHGAKWRTCSVCGTPFSIGGGQGRTDRMTCSDACRKMRSRKKETSP